VIHRFISPLIEKTTDFLKKLSVGFFNLWGKFLLYLSKIPIFGIKNFVPKEFTPPCHSSMLGTKKQYESIQIPILKNAFHLDLLILSGSFFNNPAFIHNHNPITK